MMRRLIILNLLLACLSGLQAQNFNRPVPPGFHDYEFQAVSPGFKGYFFTSAFFITNSNSEFYMAAIDAAGYLAWWSSSPDILTDLKYHSSSNQFTYMTAFGGGVTHHYIMNTGFEVIDTVLCTPDLKADGHDFLLLSNGNRLVMTKKDTVMDLSNSTFNGAPGLANGNVLGIGYQELDSDGNLVFSWMCTDHIHPDNFIDGYPYFPNRFDYAHSNAVAEDDDGHLLISFRHLDAVYKVHRQTGQIIWKLGGKNSDFSFPNDPRGFSGQHAIRKTPTGRYSLFDNANSMAPPEASRAVEYILDTQAMTATLAFEYRAADSIFGPAMGNYEQIPGGYRCVGWGDVRRPDPTMTLLDANGNVASELWFRDTVVTYRVWAQELPFHLPRPEVECQSQGGSIVLTAEAGHERYLWSTGDTTASIMVGDTGTYMVWVDRGIGWAGSHPQHIADLSAGCLNVPVPEAQEPALRDKVEGYYDLMGRRLPGPLSGQICVERYRSGRARLVCKWQ